MPHPDPPTLDRPGYIAYDPQEDTETHRRADGGVGGRVVTSPTIRKRILKQDIHCPHRNGTLSYIAYDPQEDTETRRGGWATRAARSLHRLRSARGY